MLSDRTIKERAKEIIALYHSTKNREHFINECENKIIIRNRDFIRVIWEILDYTRVRFSEEETMIDWRYL